jgi:indole-3-glycerol phosphate synthase
MELAKIEGLAAVKQALSIQPARTRKRYCLESPGGVSVIAEVKRSSPARGMIRDVDAVTQAVCYRNGGAVAVSVLTDGVHFGESYADLRNVASAVDAPVLCKEFVYFEEQIELASLCGADLVLLIARCLSPQRLSRLYRHALACSIEPLVEVHARYEIEAALAPGPGRLLVNTRNLATLAIDRDEALATVRAIPPSTEIIIASGMQSPDDVRRMAQETGARLFLVGSALMESHDPEGFIREASRVC